MGQLSLYLLLYTETESRKRWGERKKETIELQLKLIDFGETDFRNLLDARTKMSNESLK